MNYSWIIHACIFCPPFKKKRMIRVDDVSRGLFCVSPFINFFISLKEIKASKNKKFQKKNSTKGHTNINNMQTFKLHSFHKKNAFPWNHQDGFQARRFHPVYVSQFDKIRIPLFTHNFFFISYSYKIWQKWKSFRI